MEAIVPILIPASFIVMLVLERLFPARPLPKARLWLLRGFLFFVLGGVIAGIVPVILTGAFGKVAPLHAEALGIVPAAILSALLSDLLFYGIHRILHNVPFLWRWTHQMHHASERMDIAGGAIFHPFDLAVLALPSAVASIALGLSTEAAALAGLIGFWAGFFPHLNVRTPQWVGWFVQRPEAHSVHHGRGIHAYNYGNFPFWDMLLGTYRNPATFNAPAGFWDGASDKIGAMLIGRDVAEPQTASASAPAAGTAAV